MLYLSAKKLLLLIFAVFACELFIGSNSKSLQPCEQRPVVIDAIYHDCLVPETVDIWCAHPALPVPLHPVHFLSTLQSYRSTQRRGDPKYTELIYKAYKEINGRCQLVPDLEAVDRMLINSAIIALDYRYNGMYCCYHPQKGHRGCRIINVTTVTCDDITLASINTTSGAKNKNFPDTVDAIESIPMNTTDSSVHSVQEYDQLNGNDPEEVKKDIAANMTSGDQDAGGISRFDSLLQILLVVTIFATIGSIAALLTVIF